MPNDLTQFAHDTTISDPGTAVAAITTTGIGISTVFGILEKGVGFAAAIVGLMVTVALWRKLRLERREAELRIEILEKKLANTNNKNFD